CRPRPLNRLRRRLSPPNRQAHSQRGGRTGKRRGGVKGYLLLFPLGIGSEKTSAFEVGWAVPTKRRLHGFPSRLHCLVGTAHPTIDRQLPTFFEPTYVA